MIYLALPAVGCRVNNSVKCADGMCLPSTVTCDGVQYCTDGSTFDVLCGKLLFTAIPVSFRTTYFRQLFGRNMRVGPLANRESKHITEILGFSIPVICSGPPVEPVATASRPSRSRFVFVFFCGAMKRVVRQKMREMGNYRSFARELLN